MERGGSIHKIIPRSHTGRAAAITQRNAHALKLKKGKDPRRGQHNPRWKAPGAHTTTRND